MNRMISAALGVLLSTLVARAELRTFTSVDGRKVEGEILKVEDGTAFVKLANGSSAKIPLTSLAAEDQASISKWWEENKDKLEPINIRLTIDRNHDRLERKVDRPKVGGNQQNQNQANQVSKKLTIDEFNYTCTLKNYTPRDINNITAEYTIYKRITGRNKSGSKNDTKEIRGEKLITFLEATGSTDFNTEKVKCEDSSESGGGGGGGRGGAKSELTWQRETILGIVVTLRIGDKEILKQSDPENLLTKLREAEQREYSRD